MKPESTYFDDLLALQAELKNPPKTEEGYAGRYTYATLPDMLDAIKPTLTAHNFFLSQLCDGDQLITKLIHKSGAELESRIVLSSERVDAQKYGSWMTYMRRYAILAMFSLAGEDDDGQATVNMPEKLSVVAENVAEPQERAGGDLADKAMILNALKRYPSDGFLLSIKNGVEKYGHMTEKQRAAVKGKMDQPYQGA